MRSDFLPKARTIKCEIKGGFGNQLFQLANVVNIAVKSGSVFKLSPQPGTRDFALNKLGLFPNVTYLPLIVDSKLTFSSVQVRFPIFSFRYKELAFSYSEIPNFRKSLNLEGYFQSYKYFEDIGLLFKSWLIEVLGIGEFKESNGINLHIRLGDIARNKKFLEFHGLAPSSYFIDAISNFNLNNPEITVVTDDLELIGNVHRELFLEYPSARIVSNSLDDDFKFLASSKNLVISNSTFSWWAAYLSSAKIVAPSKWFADSKVAFNNADFFPPGWVIL